MLARPLTTAFAFLAMFGGTLLEFFGQNLRTLAHTSISFRLN
jgi:hypothetical protein